MASVGGLWGLDNSKETNCYSLLAKHSASKVVYGRYNWYKISDKIVVNLPVTTVTQYGFRSREYGGMFVAHQYEEEKLIFGIYYNSPLHPDQVRNIYLSNKDMNYIIKNGGIDKIYIHNDKEFALYIQEGILCVGIMPRY